MLINSFGFHNKVTRDIFFCLFPVHFLSRSNVETMFFRCWLSYPEAIKSKRSTKSIIKIKKGEIAIPFFCVLHILELKECS